MTNKEFTEKYTGSMDTVKREIKLTDKETNESITMHVSASDIEDLKCLNDESEMYTKHIKEKIIDLFNAKK